MYGLQIALELCMCRIYDQVVAARLTRIFLSQWHFGPQTTLSIFTKQLSIAVHLKVKNTCGA
jgi:hypothetical protein